MPIPAAAPAIAPDAMLLRPGAIGRLALPSRVLMAPMEKNLCTADGRMTPRYVDYLVERARGGVGLMRIEATYVDPVGKGRPFQCGAHADHVVPALRAMADAVHAAGGRVSVELAHCGRQVDARITGFQPVAPSAVPCALSGGFIPRALTVGEIADIVERFAAAARRVVDAGLDAVEIHGASGYLLNAFLSPYANLRDDAYGGSLENRTRAPLEVVAAIRAEIGPDVPLLYRLTGDDGVGAGGLEVAESARVAAALERAGVDLIDVSAGTYESITVTQPPMEAAPGGLVALAAAIKASVSIPVATAGKLGDLAVAEAALQAGAIDFVTIGRGLHAEPRLVEKARAGRLAEARRCIACAECVGFLGQDLPAYCAINPATIREAELGPAPRPAPAPRSVLVVGAGPAGLEAARAARLRGHEVEVYEQERSLGGQVRLGALAAGREDLGEPVRYLARELDRLGVPVHLGRRVDDALVREAAPDVLVMAAGAARTASAIPGADQPHVVECLALLDALAGGSSVAALPAGAVVVVGGSWRACHAADILLAAGREVTLVETGAALATDIGEQQGHVLRERVRSHPRCTVVLGATVEAIEADRVRVWSSAGGATTVVQAALVVIASRLAPQRDLADRLRASTSIEVHVVGDAVEPRRLADALLEGARVGARI